MLIKAMTSCQAIVYGETQPDYKLKPWERFSCSARFMKVNRFCLSIHCSSTRGTYDRDAPS